MSPRRFSILWGLVPVLLFGCAASSGSGYDPAKLDFEHFSTFTCVRYSELAGDSSLPGPQEDRILYALANEILARGYEYTDILDSADFIATVRVTNPGHPLLAAPAAPPFRRTAPFRMDTTAFAKWEWQPAAVPVDSGDEIHPKINVILYASDSVHTVLRNWQVSATAKSNDLLLVSQYVLGEMSWRVPFSAKWRKSDWYSSGASGFGFAIRSQDGINFWPEITVITRGYPAERVGLHDGDMILSVNGHSLCNLNFLDCLRRFRADAGRDMELTVWRYPATTFDVSYQTKARP